jgi:hypothetical protein
MELEVVRYAVFVGLLSMLGLTACAGTPREPPEPGATANTSSITRTAANATEGRVRKPSAVVLSRSHTERGSHGSGLVSGPGSGPSGGCAIVAGAVPWIHVRGACRQGYAHGDGEARSRDGRRRYRGRFQNGAFHGKGIYEWGDGTIYRGDFVNGRKAGQGAISHPDGSSYEGQFKEDLYHGAGIYRAADGSSFRGEFQDGAFHGRGIYQWVGGEHYEGGFRQNDMAGEGIFRWRTGESYVGEFLVNQPHGTGTYRWPDGVKYTGRFENGEINGDGSLVDNDGTKYVGRFRKGEKHGPGRLVLRTGEIRQQWENGRKVTEENAVVRDPQRQVIVPAGRDNRSEPPGPAN